MEDRKTDFIRAVKWSLSFDKKQRGYGKELFSWSKTKLLQGKNGNRNNFNSYNDWKEYHERHGEITSCGQGDRSCSKCWEEW